MGGGGEGVGREQSTSKRERQKQRIVNNIDLSGGTRVDTYLIVDPCNYVTLSRPYSMLRNPVLNLTDVIIKFMML